MSAKAKGFPYTALKKDLLVDIYDDGAQKIMLGGKVFFTLSDTDFGKGTRHDITKGKHPGVRPRWAVVLSAGEDALTQGIKVGDKVLCDSLRWSRGYVWDRSNHRKLWRIPLTDVLGVDLDGLSESDREHIAHRHREEFED